VARESFQVKAVVLCSVRKKFVEFSIEDWKSASDVYWEEGGELGDTVTIWVAMMVVCPKVRRGKIIGAPRLQRMSMTRSQWTQANLRTCGSEVLCTGKMLVEITTTSTK